MSNPFTNHLVESPADERLQKLAFDLMERRNEGVIVPRVIVSHGNWRPSQNRCHHNVTELAEREPSVKPIHGWLHFDFTGLAASILCPEPWIEFLGHSVIERVGGRLEDITPVYSADSQNYPFIRHGGDEADYAAIIDGYPLSRIRIYSSRIVYCA